MAQQSHFAKETNSAARRQRLNLVLYLFATARKRDGEGILHLEVHPELRRRVEVAG